MHSGRNILSAYNAVRKCYRKEVYQKSVPCLFMQSFRPLSLSGARKNSKHRVTLTLEMEDGSHIPVTADAGATLRDVVAAHKKEVGEDYGICDGTLACSTCHVIFSQKDYDKLPGTPTDEEMDILDLAPNSGPTSRLACSIMLTTDMNGMLVKVPNIRNDARSMLSTDG